MHFEYSDPALDGFFRLTEDPAASINSVSQKLKLIHILWNHGKENVEFIMDGAKITLQPEHLTTVTYLQRTEFSRLSPQLITYSFNREFYCIHDHDHEVSCNGIIFFGSQQLPIITLAPDEAHKFQLLHQVFIDEFQTRDNIQGEMLQMLLKRLIIKITRLARAQMMTRELDHQQIDIVRKFNTLVDLNYRAKKQVADYAELLFKSPKTLSNLFAKYNQKSPLHIIHERITLEARRLLIYTDKTAKEIAYDLGFDEVASFHKMFKKITGETPQQFKTSHQKASNAAR